MSNFIKKEISPYIIVYKNAIDKPEDLVDLFEQTIKNDNLNYMFAWEKFGEPKTVYPKGFRTNINFHPINNFNEEINVLEKKWVEKLFSIRQNIFDDYILSYKDKDIWPEDILNAKNNVKNFSHGMSVVKHDIPEEGEDLRNSYLLGFHLDSIFNPPEFGREHIITMMMYLNDDYLEGEISFLVIDNDKKIISYKPQAGDIVIFPSFYPFYHSVNKPLVKERYAIRTSYDMNLKNAIPNNNNTFTENLKGDLPEAYYNKEKVIYIDGKNI
jgi:hypothetical protein